MAALKRVFGNISNIWYSKIDKTKEHKAILPCDKQDNQVNYSWNDNLNSFSTNENIEGYKDTKEDFSVDLDLEERLIREAAGLQSFRDYNFASIHSTNNEYSYLASPLPVDLDENIYSCIHKNQLLFIDSKRICLADISKQTATQMFLKREIENITILSHTLTIRRHKMSQKLASDLMLLDISKFQDIVPYLQIFYVNLL